MALVALVVVAALGCVVGALLDPARAAASYLAAYAAVLGIVLGTLLLAMTVELSGGSWLEGVWRQVERVLGTLPLLALLFIPVVLGAGSLYPWLTAPDALAPEVRAAVTAKQPYLSPGFALARAIVYWIVWIGVGELMRRAVQRREVTPEATTMRRVRTVSAAGIPLVALTMTFAAVDWLMSLMPEWSSSIYAVYWYAGATVAALALLAVLAGLSLRRSSVAAVTTDHLHAMGKLLLTFVLFWAYLGFAQYLIIWIGDMPREVGWYVVRTRGSWGGLGIGLIVGHFLVPLLLLLIRAVKRSAPAMIALGGWMLAMHYVDIYWLVLPNYSPRGITVHWLDLASIAFVSGVTIAAARWRRAPEPIARVPVPAERAGAVAPAARGVP